MGRLAAAPLLVCCAALAAVWIPPSSRAVAARLALARVCAGGGCCGENSESDPDAKRQRRRKVRKGSDCTQQADDSTEFQMNFEQRCLSLTDLTVHSDRRVRLLFFAIFLHPPTRRVRLFCAQYRSCFARPCLALCLRLEGQSPGQRPATNSHTSGRSNTNNRRSNKMHPLEQLARDPQALSACFLDNP